MHPRKNSRLTTVVGSGKNKPSAFKSLCLPDTGFMVDFLGFFTRDDFEKYLQLTCKRMNQLILTHFPSKPYRYLEDVKLTCYLLKRNIELSLSKRTTENRFSTLRWDPSTRQWTNSNCFVGFSKMFPFLDMSVRVPKIKIWIRHNTIMSQESIDQLKSLSHIWKNAQVGFTTDRYSKENLVTCAELLRETKLFCCRQLKCSSMDDVMIPLWDYPEIYALESVKVNFTKIERMKSDVIVKLVENQALYPHSQTTFVFSGNRYVQFTYHGNGMTGNLRRITSDILRNIGNKLMESDKAQSFRIVFVIYPGSELPDGKMNEIRLENKRTREVLHIRLVTDNEMTKYCKFDPKAKYFILERFLAK